MVTREWLESWLPRERLVDERPWTIGALMQRERLSEAVRMILEHTAGDVLEIGVLTGGTAKLLVPIAAEFGRKYMALDNWAGKRSGDVERAIFMGNVEDFPPRVCTVWDMDAHSPEAKKNISGCKLAFAYVDDGHQYSEVISELRSVLPVCVGPVAVDDVWLTGVSDAIDTAIEEHPGWEEIRIKGLRESWLLPRE